MDDTSEDRAAIRAEMDKRHQAAVKRYQQCYNNALYQRATAGKRTQRRIVRANKMLDEAMAMCGSPYYKVTYTKWTDAEIDFLAPFV